MVVPSGGCRRRRGRSEYGLCLLHRPPRNPCHHHLEKKKGRSETVAVTKMMTRIFVITVFLCFLGAASLSSVETSLSRKVILIRHGEKPASGNNLSKRGYQRAACLAKHFVPPAYNVTHMYAYTDKSSQRSSETLTPLSKALGVPIDTSVGRDDTNGLVSSISKLVGDGIALVCWEHKALTDIAGALGVKNPPSYPSSEFDWQWTIVDGTLTQANENC